MRREAVAERGNVHWWYTRHTSRAENTTVVGISHVHFWVKKNPKSIDLVRPSQTIPTLSGVELFEIQNWLQIRAALN